jgi:phosphoenolpyruvate synthase/pyruvate phosphate dikinase
MQELTGSYVLGLEEIDPTRVRLVGGKGAQLAALTQIEGISMPTGFCVTTDAFRRIVARAPAVEDGLAALARLDPEDRDAIGAHSAEIRRAIEAVPIPGDVAAAVTDALTRYGKQAAYAVRSSATAEDLPAASFAGQQDTYLSILGPEAILEHVSRCWASLFTERAVAYRLRNGFDHRKVQMAVVVQQMVLAEAAGILFTADPVTCNRKVASVEAGFGLGEALVSGLVNADSYKVRDGAIVSRTIATKQLAIYASPAGGTHQRAVEPEHRDQPTLTDPQVVRLVELGKRIEAHFGCPQDIEWCLADTGFQIVQSRPITTLFPIPETNDRENHVYISVGHQQMMTDAIKPLGISVWQLTALRPMPTAGGRLFVDVTTALAEPTARAGLLEMVGRSDPLIADALRTIVERGDFLPPPPETASTGPPRGRSPSPLETDPAIVPALIERHRTSIGELKHAIESKSGSGLVDFITADIRDLQRRLTDPQSHQAVMAGMEATWWLNDHLLEWLGEKNAADTLTLSAPNNVTSEMGLALLDVADVIRPHPDVVALLASAGDDFMDELPNRAGGQEARDAIDAYLDKYGMRCVGEIDITRPRWSERPTALLPAILANIEHAEPGAAVLRFEQGLRKAQQTEHELLARLRVLPGGYDKVEETKRMIDRLRTFIGYREYPKYDIVSHYFVYKKALLEEAARLVRTGVLGDAEEIFYLTLEELHEVVRTGRADNQLTARRKDDFRTFEKMTPPRVLTSDGERVIGAYHRDDVPAGALIGLPVSAGTVAGRARVVLNMESASLEPDDILVTKATDPSWSPLFPAIAGLVTEVGGLMTHGAVIAREYGLPAVVGVEQATHLIRDGQRIRVHGTEGYVEIVPEAS